MYKIVGIDSREYGPISGEQLRQWVLEGRANGQTQVQEEGCSDWKPLAEFPDFFSALTKVAAPPVIQVPPPLVVTCSQCQTPNHSSNYRCTKCGQTLRVGGPPLSNSDNATLGTLIPCKNPPALMAYYCGIFSLIPCFGLILGIVALILGVKGLRLARENPEAKGEAHAWVGIILGGTCALANLVGLILIVGMK